MKAKPIVTIYGWRILASFLVVGSMLIASNFANAGGGKGVPTELVKELAPLQKVEVPPLTVESVVVAEPKVQKCISVQVQTIVPEEGSSFYLSGVLVPASACGCCSPPSIYMPGGGFSTPGSSSSHFRSKQVCED